MSDSFDALLNKTCTVLRRPTGPLSGYGNKPKLPTEVFAENVPCRVSIHRAQRPHEFKDEMKLADDRRVAVYMRPLPGLGVHDWLRIAGYPDMDVNTIHDPGGMGHHYEVIVDLLYP